MSASLVGSEMCIRDRLRAALLAHIAATDGVADVRRCPARDKDASQCEPCLLYTSDAADDM
eukprot:8626657-Alexandrium_andersonii.AAC.1